MTISSLHLGLAAAALVTAAGLVLAWSALSRGGEPGPARSRAAAAWANLTGASLPAAERRRRAATWATGAAFGAVCWLLTAIPIIAMLAALLVPFGRYLLSIGKAEAESIKRLDAVGKWCLRLERLAATGTGLQEAIVSSRAFAPEAIETELGELCDRLTREADPEAALRDFADALADPEVDTVAALLILHLSDHGAGLRTSLANIAATCAKKVALRRETEAEREKARSEMRSIVLIMLIAAALALAAAGGFAQAYSGSWQLYMAMFAAAFAAILAWMARMNQPARSDRILGADRRRR